MANHQITINYESETGILDVSGSTTASNRLEVLRNDTIEFVNTSQSHSASVFNIDADKFTPQSWVISSGGQSKFITANEDATQNTDDITVQVNGVSKTLFVEVVTSIDTTPDPFNIGDPVLSADLSTYYRFASFKVTGVSPDADVSMGNARYYKNGEANFLVTGKVENGDIIEVEGYSSGSYATQTTHTMTIGTVTNSNTITTKNNPAAGAFIPFPHAEGNISLKKVTEFFAAPIGSLGNPPRKMSAYRRGGLHVPDISQNQTAGVANTTQTNDLVLSSFAGSGTTVYFDKYPANKNARANTIDGAKSLTLNWTALTDWTLGYSPLTPYNVAYSYELTEQTTDGYVAGVTFKSNAGGNLPPNGQNFTNDNTSFNVSASAPQNTEQLHRGTVKIRMQSLIQPSLILESTITYRLTFYGP